MNSLDLKDPFQDIVQHPKLSPQQKRQQLVLKYIKEKHEALKLYGTYSIKKINWLQDMMWKAKHTINSADQVSETRKPGFVHTRYNKPVLNAPERGTLLFDTTDFFTGDMLPD